MHIIRLRGPWRIEPLERFSRREDGGYDSRSCDLSAHDRCQMPADWRPTMGPDFLGSVRYCRTFNRPTNLTQERVWLVVEPPRSRGQVRCNGQLLGHVEFGGALGRFDITSLLKDYNAVEIDVAHPSLADDGRAIDNVPNDAAGGLVGEVRLEIEE